MTLTLVPITILSQQKNKELDNKIAKTFKNVSAFINQGGDLEDVDKKYYSNKELILKSISNFDGWDPFPPTPPVYLSTELMNDNVFMKKVLCLNGLFLAILSDEQKRNKDLVLTAISQNTDALEYADETLRNDEEVVLAAIKSYGYALKFASNRLKADKDIVKKAIINCDYAIALADSSLLLDIEFMNEVIALNPSCYKSVIQIYGENIEMISKTLKVDRSAINKIPAHFLCDTSITEIAISFFPRSYLDCCDAIKLDKNIAFEVMKSFRVKPNELPEQLKGDSVFMNSVNLLFQNKSLQLNSIKKYGLPRYLNENPTNDFDIALAICKLEHIASALKYCDSNLRDNEELVLEAIHAHASNYTFISERLKKDKKFLEKAFKANPNIISYLPEKYRKSKEYMLKAINFNRQNINVSHSSLFGDDDLFNACFLKE